MWQRCCLFALLFTTVILDLKNSSDMLIATRACNTTLYPLLFIRILKTKQKYSTSNFAAEYESIHIPTTFFQKSILSVGSSLVTLLDPTRADMLSAFGEVTGENALNYMLEKMLQSPEGQDILKDQPRINTNTVDISKLESLPEDTLGKAYFNFLEFNKVTPDSRPNVQFVDDVELAYVMQRYREAHDFIHTILNQPTNMLGEVTVKWVEAFQTRLPMCISGALFGAVRLRPKQRQQYITKNLPWAIKTGLNSQFILNIYFEKRWEQSMRDLRRELNIIPLAVQ